MKKRDFLAGAGGSLAAGAFGALAPGLARAAAPWQPEELAEGTVDSATLEALPGKVPLIKRSYRPTNYTIRHPGGFLGLLNRSTVP